MPVNPNSRKNAKLTSKQSLKLFSGRKYELKMLGEFVDSLKNNSAKEQLLHIFGTAGIGKSLLLEQFATTKDGYSLAIFNVDSDIVNQNVTTPNFLWYMRQALRQNGVSTPLYDLYYVTYFTKYENPGVSITLPSLLSSIRG